jgi:hypothetical protein
MKHTIKGGKGKMNNFEKIKAMNIDEMALYLISYELYQILNKEPLKYRKIKQWLESEEE